MSDEITASVHLVDLLRDELQVAMRVVATGDSYIAALQSHEGRLRAALARVAALEHTFLGMQTGVENQPDPEVATQRNATLAFCAKAIVDALEVES